MHIEFFLNKSDLPLFVAADRYQICMELNVEDFYDVCLPYDVNDPSRGFEEEVVFTSTKQSAMLKVATHMAANPQSNCETDEDRTRFIQNLVESIAVDEVVRPRSSQVSYLLAGLFGITEPISLVALGETLHRSLASLRPATAIYRNDPEYYANPAIYPSDALFGPMSERVGLVPPEILESYPLAKFPYFFAFELRTLFNISGPLDLNAAGRLIIASLPWLATCIPLGATIH